MNLSLLFIVQYLLLRISDGLIHKLIIRNDDRDLFKIETFGFVAGGVINITVNDFSVHDYSHPQFSNKSHPWVGFLLRKSSSESAAQQDIESSIEEGTCILETRTKDDLFIDLSDQSTWPLSKVGHIVRPGAAGLYSLIFARCKPPGAHTVSFKLFASFHNPGPNYLSAGDAPLPFMYFCFFLIFTLTLGLWLWILFRPSTNKTKVHFIHYMMAILVTLKALTLLFESIRYHYIAVSGAGTQAEAWSIIFYVFAFLKGVMLFTVILLIGSGWSLMKSYLNEKEKKIILVVLSLQVLDNVAMVILEETSPGSQIWLTWRDILHLVDILCCCAILFPIVWSIRHLRQAAEADGKAQANLVKLQLFRQFYVMVVVYVYFTRIVVFLLAATIPFYLMWLGPLFTEIATLIFFVVTGFKFQPADDNPYLPVRTQDEDGKSEYGLGEEGVLLTSTAADD